MSETLSVQDAGSGFFRLITNPAATDTGAVSVTDDEALIRTRDYAFAVLKGKGGSPYCPIVRMVEEANAYRVRIFRDLPGTADFPTMLDLLEAKYRHLSPGKTEKGQPLDVTTVIAAYSHSEANAEYFLDALKAMHEVYRLRFIRQGLMLAYMHPRHPVGSSNVKRPDPGTEPVYLSGIPLVVVRRMISADDRFMRTPEEQQAYEGFFGPSDATTGWRLPS